MKPQVIIIGRPNVGKSTLFNRLVGKKLALVDDQPGVTRDRRMGDASLAGLEFTIIDTAGWEDEDEDTLPGRMRKQTEVSVEGADAALFVIDARAGLTPLDEEIARWLRTQEVPVVAVANKAEGSAGDAGLFEAFSLGFGEPVALSAEHGEGVADLFDALWPLIGEKAEGDRKSTRLNSSHVEISYAVFCLKKKKKEKRQRGGVRAGGRREWGWRSAESWRGEGGRWKWSGGGVQG